MKSWWFFVRTGVGSFIKVIIQAENSYVAYEMAKAQYGSQLISSFASVVD